MKFPSTTAALFLTICALTATGCRREVSQPTTRTDSAPSQIQPASLVRDDSTNSSDDVVAAEKPAEPTMLPGPNAVPKDTRIVVNIPAFRMDLFKDGTLVKSYKVGIGYPEYPLPRGLRKAEMIIFNPTWTPPNEPWVANPGVVVPAGSKANPLGPIKIPIGGASLIHGGKPRSKIGTFASHGCVGLTNDQVKDFAKVLADAARTELATETMASYLKRPSRTQVVKLAQIVPVELRYETIVVEDGRVRIYRDVYGQKTNTEENLRLVLDASGVSFDELREEEKSQLIETLNILSGRIVKKPTPAPTPVANQNSADRAAAATARKAEAERLRKLRSQKEFEVVISALSAKGYPATKDLNSGAADLATAASVSVTPQRRSSPTSRVMLQSRPSRANPVVTPQPRTSPTNPDVTPLPRTSPTPALR